MGGLAIYLCLASVLIFIPGIKSEHNANLTFAFKSKNDSVVDLTESSIRKALGEGVEIGYEMPLSNGIFQMFFGSYDSKAMTHLVYEKNIGMTSSRWELSDSDSTLAVPINNEMFPCGPGFLLARISDGIEELETQALRAVMKCNITDVDIELEVKPDPMIYSSEIQLRVGGDVNEAVKNATGMDLMVSVRNVGNEPLRASTSEVPHLTLAFLQRRNAPRSENLYCSVPDITVRDKMVWKMKFQDRIEVNENKTFSNPGVMIPDATICGQASLVILLDPLHTFDGNHCNNYKIFDVYVDCSYSYMQKCMVYPNILMQGHQMYSTFVDPYGYNFKVYEHQSTFENYWKEMRMDAAMDERMGLMGLARLQILQEILEELYEDPDSGLCVWTNQLDDDSEFQIPEDIETMDIPTTEMPTADPQAVSLTNRIENIRSQLKMRTISDTMQFFHEIHSIENDLYMVGDTMLRYKLSGIIMGLNYSSHIVLYEMHGVAVPSNASRILVGHILFGIVKSIVHANMYYHYMPGQDVAGVLGQHIAMLETIFDNIPLTETSIKNNILQILRYLMAKAKSSMSLLSDTSINDCPFRFYYEIDACSATPAIKHLLHLADSVIGDYEEYDIPETLPRCHRRLLPTFFRYGGMSVAARDITQFLESKAKSEGKDLSNIPDGCRKHPLMPLDVYPVYWKVQDDRIMRGVRSLWTGKMNWKIVGRCLCNSCHYYGYNSHSSTYGYYGNWQSTTSSYNNWQSPSHHYNHATTTD